MGADRPKPPDGHDSWLDAVMDVKSESHVYVLSPSWLAHARAELEELREKVKVLEAAAAQNEEHEFYAGRRFEE